MQLHLCKQFRMCTHTVSFRRGFGSSLRTHTRGPHHPWAPSFRQYPLWLPLSTMGRCRHRSSVSSDYASMGGCHSHSLASPHLVSGVLVDRVVVNEIVLKQARRKSKLSSKNSLTGRKSSTSHLSIEFCKREVNQLVDFGLRRRSFQTPF